MINQNTLNLSNLFTVGKGFTVDCHTWSAAREEDRRGLGIVAEDSGESRRRNFSHQSILTATRGRIPLKGLKLSVPT